MQLINCSASSVCCLKMRAGAAEDDRVLSVTQLEVKLQGCLLLHAGSTTAAVISFCAAVCSSTECLHVQTYTIAGILLITADFFFW